MYTEFEIECLMLLAKFVENGFKVFRDFFYPIDDRAFAKT